MFGRFFCLVALCDVRPCHGGKRPHPVGGPSRACVFPTGRNLPRGKHAVPAETTRAGSLFPIPADGHTSGVAGGTGTLLCPWQLPSFSIESPAVDQVHFDALYQVHHPCPKTLSEPHSAYQVHPLRFHLVHLTTKTITTKGAETLLRPGQLVFFAARGAGTFFGPWQCGLLVAGGAGALLCPWQRVFARCRFRGCCG